MFNIYIYFFDNQRDYIKKQEQVTKKVKTGPSRRWLVAGVKKKEFKPGYEYQLGS